MASQIFVSYFQNLCYDVYWFPKRPRGRLEARRAWIAGRPTRSGRLNRLRQQGRCGGSAARRRGVLKAELAPGDAPESERRSGPQVGFPRKPLNSLDSRKKEAWITLPLALIFLPNNLDFPSPCFGNPSMNSGKSCVSRETTIPLPSRPLPMTIGGGWHGICETALCLGTKRPMGRLHR
jgi:hypothetical protein